MQPQKDYMGFEDDSDEDSIRKALRCLGTEEGTGKHWLCCQETDLPGRSCCGGYEEPTEQTQTRFSNIGAVWHVVEVCRGDEMK